MKWAVEPIVVALLPNVVVVSLPSLDGLLPETDLADRLIKNLVLKLLGVPISARIGWEVLSVLVRNCEFRNEMRIMAFENMVILVEEISDHVACYIVVGLEPDVVGVVLVPELDFDLCSGVLRSQEKEFLPSIVSVQIHRLHTLRSIERVVVNIVLVNEDDSLVGILVPEVDPVVD